MNPYERNVLYKIITDIRSLQIFGFLIEYIGVIYYF